MTTEEIGEVNAQLCLLVAILELRVKCEKPVHENDKKRLAEAQAAKLVYFQKMILPRTFSPNLYPRLEDFDIQHATN